MLQVVGYKGSGKTTLILNWIEELKNKQMKSAVIKHHGHGGVLEQPHALTDSMRFTTAGAVSSLAYGENMIQLHMHSPSSDVDQLVKMAMFSAPDIIFIEGFKQANYPKVVLVKQVEEWEALRKLSNIVGVIVHDGVTLPGVATISQRDSVQINMLLNPWIRSELNRR